MFELGKFLNSATKGGGSASKFLADPIKISVILAAIIIIIIYFIFRDIVDEEESFFGIMFRAGLFILIAVVSVVFIHNKNLEIQYNTKYASAEVEDVVSRGVEPDDKDVDVVDIQKTPGGGEKKEEGKVNVNITVNESSRPQVKSGAFKPPE